MYLRFPKGEKCSFECEGGHIAEWLGAQALTTELSDYIPAPPLCRVSFSKWLELCGPQFLHF